MNNFVAAAAEALINYETSKKKKPAAILLIKAYWCAGVAS